LADVPLTEALAALSRFLVGDGSVQDTLERVADLTVEAVSGADLAGITMLVDGHRRTAVFTDPLAPEIDQAQYDTGEGPCLDAFDQQRVFRIESTREDGPWPAFRRTAAEHGIGSTLSLPMIVDKAIVGAMNLYAHQEGAFDEEATETGMLFASQAAVVLLNANAYWDSRALNERLGEAMDHRALIEQAKGMLMNAQRCTGDQAFDLLVKASQRENVKLRDIAARLVAEANQRATEAEEA
jgi:GAF domain-containing protein